MMSNGKMTMQDMWIAIDGLIDSLYDAIQDERELVNNERRALGVWSAMADTGNLDKLDAAYDLLSKARDLIDDLDDRG